VTVGTQGEVRPGPRPPAAAGGRCARSENTCYVARERRAWGGAGCDEPPHNNVCFGPCFPGSLGPGRSSRFRNLLRAGCPVARRSRVQRHSPGRRVKDCSNGPNAANALGTKRGGSFPRWRAWRAEPATGPDRTPPRATRAGNPGGPHRTRQRCRSRAWRPAVTLWACVPALVPYVGCRRSARTMGCCLRPAPHHAAPPPAPRSHRGRRGHTGDRLPARRRT